MGRKNVNALKRRGPRRPRKINLPRNTHLMYSTDEFGEDPTVVRYLGEFEDDCLLVFHPEGYQMWVHLHHVWLPKKQAA